MSAEDRMEAKDFCSCPLRCSPAGRQAGIGLLLQVYPEFIEGLQSGFAP